MANGRNRGKKGDTGRDPGGFIALPWSVLDCPAYAALSHPARCLLLEFARQLNPGGDNNGRLIATEAYLAKRGWKVPETINRAKKALIEAGFIHETVKGHRPNKASWYAVTWRDLARIDGYDAGAAALFERGAYRKNAPLTTRAVAVSPRIATAAVVGRGPATTSPVAMEGDSHPSPTTANVVLSDIAISAAGLPH